MNILYVMIPLSLALVVLAGWAFFWAVGNGQFDDLDSPAWQVLREPADAALEGHGAAHDDSQPHAMADAAAATSADERTAASLARAASIPGTAVAPPAGAAERAGDGSKPGWTDTCR